MPQAESYNSETCNIGTAEKNELIGYLLTMSKPVAFFIVLKNVFRPSQFTVLVFMAIARGCSETFQVLLRNLFMH